MYLHFQTIKNLAGKFVGLNLICIEFAFMQQCVTNWGLRKNSNEHEFKYDYAKTALVMSWRTCMISLIKYLCFNSNCEHVNSQNPLKCVKNLCSWLPSSD